MGTFTNGRGHENFYLRYDQNEGLGTTKLRFSGTETIVLGYKSCFRFRN